MKPGTANTLAHLKDEDYISMAKIIDNSFISNHTTIKRKQNPSRVLLKCYTEGNQCGISDIEFHIDYREDVFKSIKITDPDGDNYYREITEYSRNKITDYLKSIGITQS